MFNYCFEYYGYFYLVLSILYFVSLYFIIGVLWCLSCIFRVLNTYQIPPAKYLFFNNYSYFFITFWCSYQKPLSITFQNPSDFLIIFTICCNNFSEFQQYLSCSLRSTYHDHPTLLIKTPHYYFSTPLNTSQAP